MDYWTLKKKAIMGSMQSGRLAEAEGYPLKLENAIKGSMKDYKIWGNENGLGASGNIDVVTSGKSLLKATDVYKGASNYQELVEDGRNCIRFIDNVTVKYEYTFKENTQYTISLDCKCTEKTADNNLGCVVATFFYSDGTNTYLNVGKNIDWKHRIFTSVANKTVVAIGIISHNWTSWGYIDIDTFQLEEGAEATPYEPYVEPITTTINLTGHNSIMPNEYIDFRNGC